MRPHDTNLQIRTNREGNEFSKWTETHDHHGYRRALRCWSGIIGPQWVCVQTHIFIQKVLFIRSPSAAIRFTSSLCTAFKTAENGVKLPGGVYNFSYLVFFSLDNLQDIFTWLFVFRTVDYTETKGSQALFIWTQSDFTFVYIRIYELRIKLQCMRRTENRRKPVWWCRTAKV